LVSSFLRGVMSHMVYAQINACIQKYTRMKKYTSAPPPPQGFLSK
jgi:hypothetical protein